MSSNMVISSRIKILNHNAYHVYSFLRSHVHNKKKWRRNTRHQIEERRITKSNAAKIATLHEFVNNVLYGYTNSSIKNHLRIIIGS